jgi:type IV pilus assembly protein PilM
VAGLKRAAHRADTRSDGLKRPDLRSEMPQLPSLNLTFGRRGAPQLVGLDIQPGYAAAVQASVNGSLRVERAAGVPLPGDAMREGEVLDGGTLTEALRELFGKAHLDKRVRVGVANQRTVLRMLELPPLTDRKELDAAVRFQAADQMPMPLESAVLDYHALGIVETPAGQRQRVAVVAAQRDMIERLLSAVRHAGLRPEAIDLSAFALIRALHRPDAHLEEAQGPEVPTAAQPSRILYLNVGGLTNMAVAEGTVCRFTRVVGGGLESIAVTVAERQQLPLSEARELLASVDLAAAPPDEQSEPDVRPVLESGVREIAGEVRNSIDFHRMQGGGGEVSSVVLSGPALAIAGFAQALSTELGMEVRAQTVGFVGEAGGHVAPEHLAVAAGLAVEEAPAR